MGRKRGHNSLGIQKAERAHYISKRRRNAIKKAVAARLKKVQPSQPSTPQTSSTTFNAFRIMNLDELVSHLQQITAHSAVCGSSCVIEGETYRAGHACIIRARCSKCDVTFLIPSSPRVVGSDRRKLWTVNLGAVLGQIATGGGASRLQQVMASVGVPSMSKSSFTSTERYITEEIQVQLAETMIEAGKEERRLAIENGDYFQGIPAITVIADGGWSKRSHKHSYNAKSGVAVIIGSRTKKLLFLGVRNKYCSTCSIAENAGKEAPVHMCYRNWNGSSPAMESDILVEGFRQAETTHGVRYMHLIGDGDSSVLSSIHERVPVWGRYVRKIECVNHALKNYRAKLEAIVKEKPSYKGAGKLTQKAIRRLTAGARAAIRMHAPTRDINQLRHDLRNAPYHVFGEHSKCNPAFCHVRAGTTEQTLSSEEDTSSDTYVNPPIESPTTLQQHINALVQQEEEDSLSPATLPMHDEAEARSGYTASLDQLPEVFFSVYSVQATALFLWQNSL